MPHANILIIDDDPDIALAARMTLEDAGYTVTEARSPAEGLAQIKAAPPDLLVLDVMMDTTTAGFQTALTLRSPDPESEYKAYSHIPIIMLTAIHDTTNVRFEPDDQYLPVDEFIEKPFEPEHFLSTVERLLAERRAV
ncbi:MAG: response regulator [Anaerolineales bacterium]